METERGKKGGGDRMCVLLTGGKQERFLNQKQPNKRKGFSLLLEAVWQSFNIKTNTRLQA